MTPAQHNKALRAKRKEAGMRELRFWPLHEHERMIAALAVRWRCSRADVLVSALEDSFNAHFPNPKRNSHE